MLKTFHFFIVSLTFKIEIKIGPLISDFSFVGMYQQLGSFSKIVFFTKVLESSQCAKLDKSLYPASFLFNFSLKWWS